MQEVNCLSTTSLNLHTVSCLFSSHSHTSSCSAEPAPKAISAHCPAWWKCSLAFTITWSLLHSLPKSSTACAWGATTFLQNQSLPARRKHLTPRGNQEVSASHTTTVLPHLNIIRLQNPPKQQQSLFGAHCKISQAPNKSRSKGLLISGILMVLYQSESTPTLKTPPKGFSLNTTVETPSALSHHSNWSFHQWLGESEAEFSPQHLQDMKNLLEPSVSEQRPPKTSSAFQQCASSYVTNVNNQLISPGLRTNTDFKLTFVYMCQHLWVEFMAEP